MLSAPDGLPAPSHDDMLKVNVDDSSLATASGLEWTHSRSDGFGDELAEIKDVRPMRPRIPTFDAGHVLLDRFVVQRTLFGGMGEVIVCADRASDDSRLVAFKTYSDEAMDSPEARERFVREAEAWIAIGLDTTRLNGPGVLRCESIEIIGHKPYLLMPYCSGGSLRERLAQGPAEPSIVVRWATEFLIALLAIESSGLVHRDLKPENILFDIDNKLLVSDLGIAKFMRVEADIAGMLNPSRRHSMTATGAALGTLPYMAPEQLAGVPDLDSRVDVWAFGAVVIEMATRQRAFGRGRDTDTSTIASGILHDEPGGLLHLDRMLGRGIGNVIRLCLAKDRRMRYSSIRALALAWDDQIVIEGLSPKHKSWFRRDARVRVPGPSLATAWCHSVPEKYPNRGRLVFSVSALTAQKKATSLAKLGRLAEAVKVLDDELGSATDPDSNLGRLIAGTCPTSVKFEGDIERGRVRARPPAAYILELVTDKMVLLVDLAESDRSQEVYVADLVAIADDVMRAKELSTDVLTVCAQAYVTGGRHQDAQQVLHWLAEDPNCETRVLFTLFVSLRSSGTTKELAEVGDRILKRADATEDLLDLCAAMKVCYTIRQWKMVLEFAERARAISPDDLEILNACGAALLELGRLERLQEVVDHMTALAPGAMETKRLVEAVRQRRGR